MEHLTIRKALTAAAIATGLGIAGAGAALVGGGIASADVKPSAAETHPIDWPFDHFDDLDDVVRVPLQLPSGYVALDDDWDDDWDDWGDD